jgi:cyclic lactone autoinducer peptide
MLAALAGLLGKIGAFIATTTELGCVFLLLADEPECPESLIK